MQACRAATTSSCCCSSSLRRGVPTAAAAPALAVPRPGAWRSQARRQRCSVASHATLVQDFMTAGRIYTCSPDDTVDGALRLLVEHRVTGLPVIDADGKVVGIVSDSDLLALHNLGRVKDDRQLFPAADETWQAFNEVKKLLAKSSAKRIKDVMTPNPITVSPTTDLDEAARILLTKRIHRVPVVDESGRLAGVLSRGNLVKAALALRQAAQQEEAAKAN